MLSRHFVKLFFLVVATLAVGCAASEPEPVQDPGLPPAEAPAATAAIETLPGFANGCAIARGLDSLVAHATFEPRVDYVVHRVDYRTRGALSTVTTAAAGEACANASDATRCRERLASARPTSTSACDECVAADYLVATRGDDVIVASTAADILGTLGRIDTAAEALEVARLREGLVAACSAGEASAQWANASDGFDLVLFTVDQVAPGADAPSTFASVLCDHWYDELTMRHRIHVSATGAQRDDGRDVLRREPWKRSCPGTAS